MGGKNHAPTGTTSRLHTVPASRAISLGYSEFLQANAHIEDVIVSEQGEFGAARSQISMAIGRIEQSRQQLNVASHHVSQLINMMNRPDYQPFDPITVDSPALVAELQKRGLLPRAEVVDAYLQRVEGGGYDKAFNGYMDQIALIDVALADLRDLLMEMRNDEGYQGYFWMSVETNRRPFRQAYAKALTLWSDFVTSFLTTALISTEVHLTGSGMPGLLETT